MIKRYLPLLLPLLLILSVIYTFSYPDLTISPADKRYSPYACSDGDFQGNSRIIELVQNDSVFFCRYILGEQYRYPYAGFFLRPPQEGDSTVDISAYDKVTITIDPDLTSGANVIIPLFIEDLSNRHDVSTWYYLESSIPFKPESDKYSFNLKEMRPPDWWYSMNGYSEDRKYKRNYRQMGAINIGNHEKSSFPENLSKEFSICVKEIRFSKNRVKRSVLPLTLLLICSVISSIIYFWKKRSLSLSYTPSNLKSASETNLEKIHSVISANYSKPFFSIKEIEKQTGISKITIRSLINSSYQLSFKEYLTGIRMTEAKRLLVETDCQVAEIAYAVGYQHGTTFSRIFREYSGKTPTQFRQNN